MMPPDVGALAGNDHQDRVLARALLRGTSRPTCGLANASRWAAERPQMASRISRRRGPEGPAGLILVVVAALGNADLILDHFVDQPVLVGDPP